MIYFAAALLIILGLAHSILGERYIVSPLLRRDSLPKLFGGTSFTAATLRFAWHLTTVAWWGLAATLFASLDTSSTHLSVRQCVGVTAIASATLPLILTRGRHASWLVLLIVGVLSML